MRVRQIDGGGGRAGRGGGLQLSVCPFLFNFCFGGGRVPDLTRRSTGGVACFGYDTWDSVIFIRGFLLDGICGVKCGREVREGGKGREGRLGGERGLARPAGLATPPVPSRSMSLSRKKLGSIRWSQTASLMLVEVTEN